MSLGAFSTRQKRLLNSIRGYYSKPVDSMIMGMKINQILGVFLQYSKSSLETYADHKTKVYFLKVFEYDNFTVELRKKNTRHSSRVIVEFTLRSSILHGFTYSFIDRRDGLGYQLTNCFANSDEMTSYLNTPLQKRVPLVLCNHLEQIKYIKTRQET